MRCFSSFILCVVGLVLAAAVYHVKNNEERSLARETNPSAPSFVLVSSQLLRNRRLRWLSQPQEDNSKAKTINLPSFRYRMKIIDQDIKLDSFESHLVSITVAHLETALGGALSSSQHFRQVRMEGLHLQPNLRRAFTGENSQTGEPEALVHCSFSGAVVLTTHGFLPAYGTSSPNDSSDSTPEQVERRQQEEIRQIIVTALSDTELLGHRFSADKLLAVIQDFTVNVHATSNGSNNDSQKVKTLSLGRDDIVIPVTRILMIFTGGLLLVIMVARSMFRNSPLLATANKLDSSPQLEHNEGSSHNVNGQSGNGEDSGDETAAGSTDWPVFV